MQIKQESYGDVAIYMDYENLFYALKNIHQKYPQFDLILEKCREFGRITIARAYADWTEFGTITHALYINSFEPVYVPTKHYGEADKSAKKNAVDVQVAIDAIECLYANPQISTYILITGDRDFIPVVNSIRRQGKRVIALGVAGASSTSLANLVDEFIYYGSIIQEDSRDDKKIEDLMTESIKICRNRDIPSTFANVNLVMKELKGNFRVQDYKNNQGNPYRNVHSLFFDFERRKLVKIFRNGAVNEVFLPGENPYEFITIPSTPTSGDEVDPKAWEELKKVFLASYEEIKPTFTQLFNTLVSAGKKEGSFFKNYSDEQINELITHAINSKRLLKIKINGYTNYTLNY